MPRASEWCNVGGLNLIRGASACVRDRHDAGAAFEPGDVDLLAPPVRDRAPEDLAVEHARDGEVEDIPPAHGDLLEGIYLGQALADETSSPPLRSVRVEVPAIGRGSDGRRAIWPAPDRDAPAILSKCAGFVKGAARGPHVTGGERVCRY
jgi:hypothetical protein